MKRIDDIKEYLHGNRKGKAANRMEREALSDPFLFEALEGLTSTPGDPLDGLIRLERQLNERSRSSRKQKRTWMYIAASFAILLACGTWWFTRQEKTFDVPVMVVAQLSDSVKTKERAILTLESGSTIDLFDKTDSLTVPPGDKKQLLRSDNRAVRKKDSVREMVMEELADQEISLASVQMEDTSRLATRKMKVNDNHVSGIITDGKGNPLAGVTVLLSGSTMGVVTDANGHFSLDLPTPEGLLTFSFVGMKSQHILVKAGDKLQVKMEEDAEKMNEVVVTGYGVAKKKEVEMSNIKMQGVSVITSRQNVVLDTLVSKDDVLHFNQYMEKALRYPKADLDSNKMGSVILSFELNRKKVPSRIRIEDGFSKESNKEVIRLLAEGPKWENTPSGKRIQARIHFTIGKNGESHKAILEVLPSGRKP